MHASEGEQLAVQAVAEKEPGTEAERMGASSVSQEEADAVVARDAAILAAEIKAQEAQDQGLYARLKRKLDL